MKDGAHSSVFRLAMAGLALMLYCSGCASTGTGANQGGASATVVAPPVHTQTTVIQSTYKVPYFPPPGKLDLCGETVPLDNQDVYERFDKEFTLIVYNNAQVYLWLKRMERYFPWIEERLRANGLPEDLKYVAVAESDLLPNASSPKGAGGHWQFMPSTGRAYGLAQKGSYDERFDYERSTDSAFLYLNSLYKRFNSWSLAIAAYNCGEGRIQDEMRSQGVTSYYLMKLPLETERYVFRILAIKAVLSNPELYGYALMKGQGYPPFQVDRVSASFSKPTPIRAVAAAAGTTYREFKRLNPTFRADEIPPGEFQLKLPQGCEDSFRQNFDVACRAASSDGGSGALAEDEGSDFPIPGADESRQSVKNSTEKSADSKAVKASEKAEGKGGRSGAAPAKVASRHVVQKGETLFSIAKKYNVSVGDLQKQNNIKGGGIQPGQQLVIP